MKTIMLLTGGGALVILTSFHSVTEPGLLTRLDSKGIDKFTAHEVPLDLSRARYGAHFKRVENDLSETDDLRILDDNGDRAFRLFSFDELGPPILYESPAAKAAARALQRPPPIRTDGGSRFRRSLQFGYEPRDNTNGR